MKPKTKYLSNNIRLMILTAIVVLCALAYMFVSVKFENPKLF